MIAYYAHVRRTFIFTLAIAALLFGCDRTRTCTSIGTVTRVVVHHSSDGNNVASDRTLTDPQALHQLVAFANARRKAARPWDTMPSPQMTITFYDNANYVASLGVGPNYFFISCPKWKGIRPASKEEINQFKHLMGEAD